MTSIDSTTKTCPKCKTDYTATTEFFAPRKQSGCGLSSWCRNCLRTANRLRQKVRRATDLGYREYCQAFNRAYRETHIAEVRRYNMLYRLTKPEKQRNCNRRRRARKYAAGGSNIPFDEKAQLKRQKSRCYYCQCKLTDYHIDHVIPLARGGSDHPDNKVLACSSCNKSKRDKLPHEWLKGGRLL